MPGSTRSAARETLYRADGSRRPNAEVLAEGGDLALRLALLDDAMHRRGGSVEAESLYPPRLFVSYKWGADEENAWVAALAERLKQHGWDVVFDRYRDESADRSVEEFVSRLVTCRIFVAVLSSGFVTSAIQATRATWAYDEMQSAMIAGPRMRRIAIVRAPGLVKAGPPSGDAAVVMPPRPGELAILVQSHNEASFDEAYEVRHGDGLERFLQAHLTYTGPGLTAEESAWVAERLRRSQDEASQREILARFSFVSGAWRRLVVLLRERGALQAALDAACRAIEAICEPGGRVELLREQIELFKRCGDRLAAARAATGLIDERPQDWIPHYHLGDLLDDADDRWPARNHLLLACRGTNSDPNPYNTLGIVYMALGLLERAEQVLQQALAIDDRFDPARRNLHKVRDTLLKGSSRGATEVAGPLPGCSDCEAIFVPLPGRPAACAACGASRVPDGSACWACGAQGLAPITLAATRGIPVRCPICRTGAVTYKDRASL